jgi:hypothetical protein
MGSHLRDSARSHGATSTSTRCGRTRRCPSLRENTSTGNFTLGAVRQGSFVRWGDPARVIYESPIQSDVEWTVNGDTLRIDGEVGDWTRVWAPDMIYVWVNGEAVPYFQNGYWVEIGNLPSVPNGKIVGSCVHLR